MKTAALVLAAGSSSRMGRSKQLLDIEGEPLLTRTIRTAVDAGLDPVVVVLGADAEEHKKHLKDLPVEPVVHRGWQRGIGSSLRAGLAHLIPTHADLDAVLVMVCDQPLLTKEHLRNLISAFQDTHSLVASRYADAPGVPALFGRDYFKLLAALPDDQGAKKILLQHRAQLVEVPFPQGEVDLDTPDDYKAFLKRKP